MDGLEWRDDFIFGKKCETTQLRVLRRVYIRKVQRKHHEVSKRAVQREYCCDNVDSISKLAYVSRHTIVHTQEMHQQYLCKRSRVE